MFLLFLTLLDVLYGYSIRTAPALPPHLHMLFLPYTDWGYVWIAAGAALFFGAFLRRDRLFFGIAAFIKAIWAAGWLDLWLTASGNGREWVSVAIWGAFCATVLVVSSWPEVHNLPPEGSQNG